MKNNRLLKSEKISQVGRSMVEILGVLAVMSILTIGSTIAIRLGLITQKANAIIADANLAYISAHINAVCQTQRQSVNFETKSGKNVQTACIDGIYFAFVSNIPQNVCEKIQLLSSSQSFSVYNENDMMALSECKQDNNLAFTFSEKTFCGGTVCGSECCSSNQSCQNDSCITCPTMVPEGACKAEVSGCPTLKRLVGETCADGKICSTSLNCESCPLWTSLTGKGGQAGYGSSGYVGCFCDNANEAWNSSSQECVVCPTANSSGQGTGQLTSTTGCYCNGDTPYYSKENDTCAVCPSSMTFVGRECIFTNDNCNGVKCETGTYCKVSPSGWCQGGGYYNMNSTASCVAIPSYSTYTSKKYGKFALGSTNVNYWNANNICDALNGRLFTEADSGCSGAGAADTGVSRLCSANGWTSSSLNTGSVDENGVVQGCTYSEKLCELYHLGNFKKTAWIGNPWKEDSGCTATRMVFPGGFSLYQTRNKDSYVPFCVLN